MDTKTHIIRRISVQVKTDSSALPFQLRSRIENLCSTAIPERLAKIFSKYSTQDVIELPSIKINTTGQDWTLLQEEILDQCSDETEKLLGQLKRKVKDLQTENQEPEQSLQHNIADVFFFFLKHGILPWWATYSGTRELEEDFIDWLEKLNPTLGRVRLLKAFQQIPHPRIALTRLVSQFSKPFQQKVIGSIDQEGAGIIMVLNEILQISTDKETDQRISPEQIQNLFVIRFLECLILEDRISISRFKNLIQNRSKLLSFVSEISSGRMEQVPEDLLNETSGRQTNVNIPKPEVISRQNEKHHYYFIGNAGLIILHPFMETFFQHFQLIDEKGNFRENQIHKAIYLLQVCCSDELDPPEFNMMLNKILCGKAVEFPLEKTTITEKEKADCNELLQSIIKHWTALKNTSPSALQQTFLQRDGKLEFKDEMWWLKVEQKTEDILLDRLPWSISRIKLPWMKTWLRVEWNL